MEAFVAEPDCKFVQPFDQIVGRKRRSGRITERLAPRREMVIEEFKVPTKGEVKAYLISSNSWTARKDCSCLSKP